MRENNYSLYRLIYSKSGRMRFIGHLDMMRLFQRAVKRARLPVEYSYGFNPHQIMGFALPLPLGMAGHAECMEIKLAAITEAEIINSLNLELPEGLCITGMRICGKNEKSAASLVAAARYTITLSGIKTDLSPVIDDIISRKELIVSKKTKSKIVDADIKPDIYNISGQWDGDLYIIKAILAAGSGRYLKPKILVDWINNGEQLEADYERIELLKTDKDLFIPLV